MQFIHTMTYENTVYDEHVFNLWIKSNLAICGGGGWNDLENTKQKYIMYELIIHDICRNAFNIL